MRAQGTRVLAVTVKLGSAALKCAAYLIGGTTRCEVRPLVEGMGGKVVLDATGLHLLKGNQELSVPEAHLQPEGSFYRGDLRALAEAFGKKIGWSGQTSTITLT